METITTLARNLLRKSIVIILYIEHNLVKYAQEIS